MSRPAPLGRLGRRRFAGGAPAPHKRLDTLGLIVVAILILAITITRYWHNLHWSAR